MLPIFNCYVRNATAVNPTVVFAKFTKGGLEPIAAMEGIQLNDLLPSLPVNNAPEPPRRGIVAATEPPIPMLVAIITNKK
jgi:hypothetical protein